MAQAFDLSLLKRTKDVAGGFATAHGFVRTVKNMETGGELVVPVLGLTFETVNGERRTEICIPIPMIMPLLAELTQFGLMHTSVGQGVEEVVDNG